MKNGIIIDGKQYELQSIHEYMDDFSCDYCDLQDKCGDHSYGISLCELLHNTDGRQTYRYIGHIEDDKSKQ